MRPGAKINESQREPVSESRSAQQKILDAALEEFAAHGLEGGRVDRIARRAGINKAMIFYYYASKQNLYRTVIHHTLIDFIPLVREAIAEATDPERLFETLPALYIRYFSRKRNVVRMIGRELIHAPHIIAPLLREIFEELPDAPSKILPDVIGAWYSRGLISESDPVQFIFNIVPLCLFPLIAQPMVEAIMDVRITDDDDFLEKRIRSIANLLKRGMLQ